jgi:ABC-type sugar transport system substrate-binding protein/two-component sensor histidine kinase
MFVLIIPSSILDIINQIGITELMRSLRGLLFIWVSVISCTSLDDSVPQTVRVGFSQLTSDDLWRQTMNNELRSISAVYPDVRFELRDANYSNEKQIADVEYFIQKGVDVLIVSPNEADPLAPVIEKAYESGIPVILIDRKVSTDLYTTFIGADNYAIGAHAGQVARLLLGGSGTILEIHGAKASSPAQERHNGFISQFTGEAYQIIDAGDAGWTPEPAYQIAYEALVRNPEVDLIYAHNDVMAAAAHRAAVELNRDSELMFLGIDALGGSSGGVNMVREGILDATFLYPTGGKTAIETALKIARGEDVSKNITLNTAVINENNAEIFLLENARIREQQEILEMQQRAIEEQILKFNTQRYLLWVLVVVFLFSVAFLIFLIRANRKNKQINQQLHDNNEKLNRLLTTNNEINSVIGHDLRSPMSSTISMADMASMAISGTVEVDKNELIQMLTIIRQSVRGMADLTEDLFNWSRMQTGMMKLKPVQFNLAQELGRIKIMLEAVTSFKNVELNILQKEEFLMYADKQMVMTIVRNFISNAIKFSEQGSKVDVSFCTTDGFWKISVRDYGTGMPDKIKNKLFHGDDHPSQEGTAKETGTGLGLRLSKKMADLQNGKIVVESEAGVGSTFSLHLPIIKPQSEAK